MADGNGKPCGLLIKLEKDILGERLKDRDYALGYFDRFYIRPVMKWLDYSPGRSAPRQRGNGERQYWSISSCPIKLLFPREEQIDGLKQYELDYNVWRAESEEALSALFDQEPCVTVVLINLTDQFKGKAPRSVCGQQLRRLAEIIRRGAEEGRGYTLEDLRGAHFCIMPSLGYSDYCLLMAEKRWSLALAIMDWLHSAKVDGGVPVLSTDYMIPVFHAPAVPGGALPLPEGDELRLSVRVNLAPGSSMQRLCGSLPEDVRVWQITGAADCLLESGTKEGFRKIMELLKLTDRGDGTEIGGVNMVIASEGMLRRRPTGTADGLEDGVEGDGPAVKRSTAVNDEIAALRAAIERFRVQLEAQGRHMRQYNSLQERVTVLENICGECHNESLQLLMKEWLPSFTNCLERCTGDLERRAAPKGTPGGRPGRAPEGVWRNVEHAVTVFIEQVGSFMSDLSRSDCFFMESEQYNHASVGSATALLIAYNRWQNRFIHDVTAESGTKPESKYPFLVCSGGCDKTVTRNLFHFLEPVSVEGGETYESLPFISHMSEMSLFDCSSAILRMTHESLHYCSDRSRRERMPYLIRFISSFYGRVFTEALLMEDSYVSEQARRAAEATELSGDQMEDRMRAVWKEISRGMMKKITDKLVETLTERYEKDSASWSEINYMTRRLRPWFEERLYRLFSGMEEDDEDRQEYPFASFLYDRQLEAAAELFDRYDGIVADLEKGQHIHCFFALDARCARQRMGKPGETGTPEDVDRLLRSVIDLILGQVLAGPAEIALVRWAEPMREANIHDVLRAVVFDSFSESFADLGACLRLDADLSDYLLCFVYEDWYVDSALPREPVYICRVPAVLRVCFAGALEDGQRLSEDARNQFKEAVRGLERHGGEGGQIDADAILRRVDELLADSLDCAGESGALEDYLAECMLRYRKEDHPRMEGYSNAFKRLRLSANPADGDIAAVLLEDLNMIGEEAHV